MPPITVSDVIHRPAEEVFAYVTDPGRFPEWQKGVVSGHMESAGAPKVGDRCHTTRRIGFSNRPDTSELVRFDPPRRWGVRGLAGPIRNIAFSSDGKRVRAISDRGVMREWETQTGRSTRLLAAAHAPRMPGRLA